MQTHERPTICVAACLSLTCRRKEIEPVATGGLNNDLNWHLQRSSRQVGSKHVLKQREIRL